MLMVNIFHLEWYIPPIKWTFHRQFFDDPKVVYTLSVHLGQSDVGIVDTLQVEV